MLLEALNLKPGSGVALPLFTDPSLVRAVVAAGCRPVFIDIDPRFLTMSPDDLRGKRGRFSAVVAVHLFGQPADMRELLKYTDGLPVIEDAAHAPFSYVDNKMAGKFGIAAFYSFASTKYWPAGGGGLAVVHDPELADRFAAVAKSLARPSVFQQACGLTLQTAKSVVFKRSLYGIFGKPMRRWVEKWALLEPRLDMQSIQGSQAAIACRQAVLMPQRVEQQRANSLRLLNQLGTVQDVVFPEERPRSRYNYHLFPVLLRNREERTAIVASMWERFVDSSTLYSNSITESRAFGYHGGCPVSESVADRILTLPNYASLTYSDIDYVACAFLSSLRSYRNASPRCHSCRVLSTSISST